MLSGGAPPPLQQDQKSMVTYEEVLPFSLPPRKILTMQMLLLLLPAHALCELLLPSHNLLLIPEKIEVSSQPAEEQLFLST